MTHTNDATPGQPLAQQYESPVQFQTGDQGSGGAWNRPVSSMERESAQRKSYEIPFVVVLLLYWLGWVPGFVVNILMMNEGKRMEEIAGRSLPGVGFLVATFWINIVAAVLAVFFVIGALILTAAGVTMFGEFM